MSDSRVSKTFRVKPVTDKLIKKVVAANIAKNQTEAVDKLMASGGFFMSLDDEVRNKIFHLVSIEYENDSGFLNIQFSKELISSLNL